MSPKRLWGGGGGVASCICCGAWDIPGFTDDSLPESAFAVPFTMHPVMPLSPSESEPLLNLTVHM